jgi:hypothetical protein
MLNTRNGPQLKIPDPACPDFFRQHRFSFNPYIGILEVKEPVDFH